MKVIAVLPAFNVESRVGGVVEETKGQVDEVIVVDDGSKDRTAEIATKHGAIVIKHILNRGYGAALITGSKLALEKGASIIVHLDADGQFNPKEIKNIIEPIRQGSADIVIGSRFLLSRSTGSFGTPESPNLRDKNPAFRDLPRSKKYLILKPAIYLNRLIYSNKFTDTHNGFRAFGREALINLNLTQDGMAYCSEILAGIKKHQFRVKEVPVSVKYYEYGQGPSGGLKIIRDLFLSKWS